MISNHPYEYQPLSLPSKLCKNGVAERIITELEGKELDALYKSAEKLKNALAEMSN